MTINHNGNIFSNNKENLPMHIDIAISLEGYQDNQLKEALQFLKAYILRMQRKNLSYNETTKRFSFNCDTTDENLKILQIIVNFLIKSSSKYSQKDSPSSPFELSIRAKQASDQQFQKIQNVLSRILCSLTSFKFLCESEMNENQLAQISNSVKFLFQTIKNYIICLLVQMLEGMRELDSFEFSCYDKLSLSPDLVNSFMTAIQKVTKNSTSFIFNNPLTKKKDLQKGYKKPEISLIPGRLSYIISKIKNLKHVELNFYKIGSHKTLKIFAIQSKCLVMLSNHLTQWPTSLTKIDINLNRLINNNTNIQPQMVQQFIQDLSILVSKLSDLKEFSLDLTGIGYQDYYYRSHKFNNLCDLIHNLKSVNKLSLSVNINSTYFAFGLIFFYTNKVGGHLQMVKEEWERFFTEINNIEKLVHLNLNVKFWDNFENQQINKNDQKTIILNFFKNLVKNHKHNLQYLALNLNNWYFLKKIRQSKLLKMISEIEYLNTLKLLSKKTRDLQEYSLFRQAEQYYSHVKDAQLCIHEANKCLLNITSIFHKIQEQSIIKKTQEYIDHINKMKSFDLKTKEELVRSITQKIHHEIVNIQQFNQQFKDEWLPNMQNSNIQVNNTN